MTPPLLTCRSRFTTALLVFASLLSSLATQAQQTVLPKAIMPTRAPDRLPSGERPWEPVSESEIEKIDAALPSKAEVTPKKPRRLLVFYRADGYPHSSIPHWNKFIELLGKKTGAFTADFSQSYADLSAESLEKYDAVFFNNTCRMQTPENVKEALQAFVRKGKGFSGNHGSGDNWHDWPEGAELLGCEFVNHPFGRIQIKVDDPQSPVTAVFGGKSFPFSDEIYAFKDPYSREKLRILLSIDYPNSPDVQKAEQTLRARAEAPEAKDNDKRNVVAIRPDKDYAIAWIRRWEKGRVFYCSLGHRAEVVFDPAIARFNLAGIQYALGDLEANDLPSGKLPPAPANPAEAAPTQKPVSQTMPPLYDELQFAPGFDVTPFAGPPMVNSPVFLSANRNGDVYVSSDQNGSVGTSPGNGKIIRLRDTDGDGRADAVNEFAIVDAPRGLVADGDTVYVLHPPHLSAFIDRDGDGKSDEQRILVKDIGWGYSHRRADHGSNGLEMGIDGWLYAAIGDFGFQEAVGADGRKLPLRAGGVVRVRPDGTGLELYSYGTRNILEAAISPLLDGFARDNTNDGGGWNTRLHHFSGLDDHGYPRLFKNFTAETIQPIADYGGGSGCGATWISEPGWPSEWNNRPLTADWGREIVYGQNVTASGASFLESGPQLELAKVKVPGRRNNTFRPSDIEVDSRGFLYLASWTNGGFGASPKCGFLFRLHPKGRTAPPPREPGKLSTNALAANMGSASHRTRLDSQRELLQRPVTADAQRTVESIAADVGQSVEVRVAALYTLALWLPDASAAFRENLTKDVAVGAWAIRSLGDTASAKTPLPAQSVQTGLRSPDARIRRESVFALYRSGDLSQLEAVTPLLADEDARVRHMTIRALALREADAACLAALDSPASSENVREGALLALQTMHRVSVVDALTQRLARETIFERRKGILAALCRLFNQEGKWAGDSWGTRPDDRGPYYQPEPWEQTERIGSVLSAAIQGLSGEQAAWLGNEMARNRVQLNSATGRLLEIAAKDPNALPALLLQLADSDEVPQSAIPILIRVATDAEQSKDIRNNAIIALTKTDNREAFAAILKGFTLPAGGERYWKSRTAFLEARHLENHCELFVESAATTKGGARYAEEALMKLLGRKFGSPEARAMALEAVEKGWDAGSERRRQIISAARDTHTAAMAKKIAPLAQDPNEPMAGLVKHYFDVVKLNPAEVLKETPRDSLVGAMAPGDVLNQFQSYKGDKRRGEQLFNAQGCIACHTVRPEQSLKGPYLGNIASIYKKRELAESILEPGKSIAQGFATQVFTLRDGTVHAGFVVREAAYMVTIRTAAAREIIVPVKDITKRETLESVSMMPPGLAGDLSVEEFASLVSYLEGLSSNP